MIPPYPVETTHKTWKGFADRGDRASRRGWGSSPPFIPGVFGHWTQRFEEKWPRSSKDTHFDGTLP